jgi:hemerythrin superfamily protein
MAVGAGRRLKAERERRAGDFPQGVGMDATALLRSDHRAVDALFSRLLETSPTDVHQRRLIFRAIKSELEAHSRVEEEVFYPAVMRLRSREARETVRAALEEHQALDGLLAEIDQMEPEDPLFAARVSALRQSVERHVLAEEGALFSEARIHLTDERLEALGRRMESFRHEHAAEEASDDRAAATANSAPGGAGPARSAARDR